jgi:hypothetical protein
VQHVEKLIAGGEERVGGLLGDGDRTGDFPGFGIHDGDGGFLGVDDVERALRQVGSEGKREEQEKP